MVRYLCILALVLISMLSYSQQKYTINGLVRDKSTGEPLIGANVLVSPGGFGSGTDAYGFYSIVAVQSSVMLKASHVGYKPFQQTLNLIGNLRFDILLEPGLELAEVEVTATRRVEERLELGMTEITAAQVKQLPMLGEPDVLKAMQLLPGVQGGADGRSGLYVRGGSPDQNLFMLDGTPIYYVNHLGVLCRFFIPIS